MIFKSLDAKYSETGGIRSWALNLSRGEQKGVKSATKLRVKGKGGGSISSHFEEASGMKVGGVKIITLTRDSTLGGVQKDERRKKVDGEERKESRGRTGLVRGEPEGRASWY